MPFGGMTLAGLSAGIKASGYTGPASSGDPIQDLYNYGGTTIDEARRDPTRNLELGLRNMAGRVGGEDRVAAARNEAGAQADVAQGIYNRRTEGMALTDRQKRGASQKLNLTREVTKAAGSAQARRQTNEQSRAASQALAGLEDMKFGQQSALMTGMANSEGQRLVNEANEKAARTQRRNSAIGTALSIVGMAIFSGEEYKDKIKEQPKLLDKLKNVRVDKWRYKGSKPEHIGPYAEEFNSTFGVGTHKDSIDVVSMLGVTLGAVKELNEKVEAQRG